MIDTGYDTQTIITEGEYNRLLYVERNYDKAVEEGVAMRFQDEIEPLLAQERFRLEMQLIAVSPYTVYILPRDSCCTPTLRRLPDYKGGHDIILDTRDYNHLNTIYDKYEEEVSEREIIVTEDRLNQAISEDYWCKKYKATIAKIEENSENTITQEDSYPPYNSAFLWGLVFITTVVFIVCI